MAARAPPPRRSNQQFFVSDESTGAGSALSRARIPAAKALVLASRGNQAIMGIGAWRSGSAAQPLPRAAGVAPRLHTRGVTGHDGEERGAFVRSGMVLSCVKPGSGEPSNKWMQQTRSAPWPAGGAALAADPCVRRANGCMTEQVCRERRPSFEAGVSRRLPWQQGLRRRGGAISSSS